MVLIIASSLRHDTSCVPSLLEFLTLATPCISTKGRQITKCHLAEVGHAAANYRQIGKAAGAVVAGAATSVAVVKGREKRSQAASVALYNDLMQREDPGSISVTEVKAIGSKYGVDFSQTQVGDLQQIYSEFLAALIPTDETPLTYVALNIAMLHRTLLQQNCLLSQHAAFTCGP